MTTKVQETDDTTALAKADAQVIAEAIMGTGEFTLEVQGADEVAQALVEAILTATSDEAIAKLAETTSAGDLVGIPLRILGVKFLPTSFQLPNQPTCYALISAVEDPGDVEHRITSGSRNVMAVLLNLRQREGFPSKGRWFINARDTASGQTAHWLLPVPAEVAS